MPSSLSFEGDSPIGGRSSASHNDMYGEPSAELWHDHITFAATAAPDLLARLVTIYSSMAASLAAHQYRGHEPREDLEQVAYEALISALRRFDPDRGVPFAVFAVPTILGALRRHYRDVGWLVRVPRSVHESASMIRSATDRLVAEQGRIPTNSEVANDVGVTVGELAAVLSACEARNLGEIDHCEGAMRSSARGDELLDPGYDRAEDVMMTRAAIDTLDRDERTLIQRYFIDEQTQRQIAAELGVSQMQVSRQLREVLRRIRQRVSTTRPAGDQRPGER